MIHSRSQKTDSAESSARSRIQEAALACFTDKGLAGTTMADIAHRAGMSPAALYLHFPSKQALFESLGRPDLDVPAERVRLRRDQVLQAALKAFGQKGFAGATMDDVAHAAGLSKAALYGHFASKQELFLAVMREMSPRTVLDAMACSKFEAHACLKARLSGIDDVGEFLRELARAFFAMHRDPQRLELMRVVFAEGVRDRAVAERVAEMQSRGAAELCVGLEQFGFTPGPELPHIAGVFLGMLFSWLLQHRLMLSWDESRGEARERELGREETAAAERIVRLFLNGAGGMCRRATPAGRAGKARTAKRRGRASSTREGDAT